MRIVERGSVVTISDRPRALWAFGLWFVAGGLVALAMLFVADNRDDLTTLEKLGVAGIGLATLAAGAWVIRTHRSTLTVVDRVSGAGTHEIRAPFATAARQRFLLIETRRVEVVRSKDGDGDPMFQLRLWLADSRWLDLQAQPVHGEQRVLRDAARITELLGLASPSRR